MTDAWGGSNFSAPCSTAACDCKAVHFGNLPADPCNKTIRKPSNMWCIWVQMNIIYIIYIHVYVCICMYIHPMKHPFGIILTRSNSDPASIALKVLRSKPRKRPCRFSVSQNAGVIPSDLKTWVQSLQANEIEHLAMSRKFALENGGYDFADCFCSRKQSPQKIKSAPPGVPSSHHSLW